MYITVNKFRETDDGYLSLINGQSLTLRAYPFETDYCSLSAVAGINGCYETTKSITATSDYKLFNNGAEDKSWGGNNGINLKSEVNFLNVNSFNVGDTLVCQSISGDKYFVATSLTSALNTYVQSGTANNSFLVWNNSTGIWTQSSSANTRTALGLGYKVFKAKTSQTGTSIPATQALYVNDFFSGNPTWEYVSVGVYKSRSFPDNLVAANFHKYNESKAVYKNSNATATTSLIGYIRMNIDSSGDLQIETFDPSFAPSDGILRWHDTIEFIYNN